MPKILRAENGVSLEEMSLANPTGSAAILNWVVKNRSNKAERVFTDRGAADLYFDQQVKLNGSSL